MDENLGSSMSGHLLADFGDFVEEEFPRQDDAVSPTSKTHRRPVDGVGLDRKKIGIWGKASRTRSIKPGSDMVRASGCSHHRSHVGEVGGELGVPGKDVAHT